VPIFSHVVRVTDHFPRAGNFGARFNTFDSPATDYDLLVGAPNSGLTDNSGAKAAVIDARDCVFSGPSADRIVDGYDDGTPTERIEARLRAV